MVAPSIAFAQMDAPPEPVLPPPPPPQEQPNPLVTPPPPPPQQSRYKSLVKTHKPSPEWTQDRNFTSTRFWLLDPGNYEFETWSRTRVFDNGPPEQLFQIEAEIGVVPHLQLDIYENITFNQEADGVRRVQQEGNQIEARVAIPSYYGQIPTNPVLYFEWHPRHNAPDRFEFRLLLGGSATRWLFLAANPYVEFNVEPSDVQVIDMGGATVTQSKFVADMEFGTTLAAGFKITPWLRLSAEMKIGADMLGDVDNKLHFVWWAGPGFIVKPLPEKYRKYLKIMGTCLIGIPPNPPEAQRIEPLLIIGSEI
jgi:hypothetical protein